MIACRRGVFGAFCFLVVALSGAVAHAAPTIANVSLRGLQAGGTTVLVLDGNELLPSPQLLLGDTPLPATVREGATPQRLEFEIALPESVATGIHQLRIATATGISAPLPIAVDRLPQTPLAAESLTLPVAFTGALGGAQVVRTSFPGKAGMSLTVEVEARRLGAELNPVLHLYDPRGVQLEWGQPSAALSGDARVTVKLPEDGTYSVELHDALYRGAAPGHFRLKIGELQYADRTMPLAVQRGTKASLKLIATNLPDTTVEVDMPAGSTDRPAPLPASASVSGTPPRVLASDVVQATETPQAAGQLQTVATPGGISGWISAADEQDRYLLTVTPGQALRFDLLAARIGSPLDGILYLRSADGNQLAMNDDRPGTSDPGFDFTVPADVTQLELAVRDLNNRGGAEFSYYVSILPIGQQDYALNVDLKAYEVPAGGSSLVHVKAVRTGFMGPVALNFVGLPTGVTASPLDIPAGASSALVSLTSTAQAPSAAVATLTGSSSDPAVPLIRTATVPAVGYAAGQPWLLSEIGIATTNPSPITVAWDEAKLPAGLPLGGKASLAVQATRAEGTTGPIRLTLVTSQAQPTKVIKENNQDKTVDDVESTLRFEAPPTIAADQTVGEAALLVPANLPAIPYDLAIRAELLSADGQTVLATTFTPSRRFNVSAPFALEAAAGTAVEVRAGTGDTGTVTGKVVRQAGFAGPVRVTLAGVPAEFKPSFVDVPAEQSEFTLPVRVAYGSPAGPLAGAKLVATLPAGSLTSNEIPLQVNVVPGEMPVGEQPLKIFEDEAEFIGLLNQGGGQATLVMDDQYAGAAAVTITPDQRYNPALPSLGVNIRENPQAGEYRYMRFAWKKRGGALICLQLNHDGAWGPVAGNPGKFRYSAGAGEAYGASIIVAEQIPAEWTVVTRDLFADFGEFTFAGIALTPVDGESGSYDHIYLGKSLDDFELVKP